MKAQIVAECGQPGASVAQVAMAHGINANVVHRWRRLAREAEPDAVAAGQFIALPLPRPATDRAAPEIRIELRRGPVTMLITWPGGAAAELAAWARELLR